MSTITVPTRKPMETVDADTQRLEAILNLDLECVVLMAMKERSRWSEQRARQAVHDYRYFLALCGIYWEQPLVPSRDVDEVWHSHLFFTEKYDADCQAVFGKKLHHVPYFGHQKPEAIALCSKFLRRMPQMFETHFGFVPPSYGDIEQEIRHTEKMGCISDGWSGPVDLTKPEHLHWKTAI